MRAITTNTQTDEIVSYVVQINPEGWLVNPMLEGGGYAVIGNPQSAKEYDTRQEADEAILLFADDDKERKFPRVVEKHRVINTRIEYR